MGAVYRRKRRSCQLCKPNKTGWTSDVYVYESESGYVTHVASRRHVSKTPCPEIDWPSALLLLKDDAIKMITEWRLAEKEWLEGCTMEDIGLECDGVTFNNASPTGCVGTLIRLRGLGYIVPQSAIDELLLECKEELEGGAI